MASLVVANNKTALEIVKQVGIDWVCSLKNTTMKKTSPGSLKWLFWGEQPSDQSLMIKAGKMGEELAKKMITVSGLNLLTCGPQIVAADGKKKDLDLIWMDHNKKIVYLRELKGNIELDSEKLPATFEKIPTVFKPWLESQYPEYTINTGILNWGVYERSDLSVGLSHIRSCEKADVHVEHFGDFCTLIGFEWTKDDFYEYFKERGTELRCIIDY